MHKRGRGRPAGFTLVELMVVIAIIALLVGLLIPAVAAVRRTAKNTATKGTLNALSTGLEAYKADQKLGGAYPPSRSDSDGSGGVPLRQVRSPYGNGTFETSGAGLLVWALVGADFGGTPGFRTFRTNSLLWSQDTDATVGNPVQTNSGAYALYPPSDPDRVGLPVQGRTGPYVDLDKMKLPVKDQEPGHDVEFVIEVEQEGGHHHRDYPMFLDAFGCPILYWRADPAGRRMLDRDPSQLNSPAERGIYHWIDNGRLVFNDGDPNLPLRTDGENGAGHRLSPTIAASNVTDPNQVALGSFQYYILHEQTRAKLAPQRADTYLLVSPGADGKYGTADDVTNFEHRGS